MPRGAGAPSTVGAGPAIRGEAAGEGPPIVLCHGITATRRYVVHGSRALERAGLPRRSPTTPAATASPTPPRRGRVMDTRSWSADLERGGRRRRSGRGGSSLAGHSMGAHTAVAYALRHPERLAGLVVIGPVYDGRDRAGVARATGTGSPRRWRRAGSTASSTTSTATRGSTRPGATRCCASPASGCCCTGTPRRWSQALREVPRSRPFGVAGASWRRSTCRPWSSPATTTPTPATRTRSPRPTPRRLPRARLISEAEGESPLAWQGGRLSREIAGFYAEVFIFVGYEISRAKPRCGALIAFFARSGSASPPTSRSPSPAAARRPAWPAAAAARRSPKAPTRTSPGSTSRSSGSSATCCCSARPSSQRRRAFGGFASPWAASATAST